MSLDLLKGLGVKIPYKAKYDNFIGGKFVAPVKGEYFDVVSPITGKNYTKAARSSAEDVELALDAAHKAADAWGKTSYTERSNLLLKVADRIEQKRKRMKILLIDANKNIHLKKLDLILKNAISLYQ